MKQTKKRPPKKRKPKPPMFQYDGSLLGEYTVSLKKYFNPDEKKPTKAGSGMTWD